MSTAKPLDILILGATGVIGEAVARAAIAAGHRVRGLARSEASASKITAMGARPVPGDLREPGGWTDVAAEMDAVVQIAATWDDDAAAVDRKAMEALTCAAPPGLRLVYTGGCWLYGATGDRVAGDGPPFASIEAFADWVDTGEALLTAPNLSTAFIHPAMVYGAKDDVFAAFRTAADAGRPMEIAGAAETRWPVIHRADLAAAYLMLLEGDQTGHFNASAEKGVAVRDIAEAIGARRGGGMWIVRPIEDLMSELGPEAEGPALDQQMASPRLRALGWRPRHPDVLEYLAGETPFS